MKENLKISIITPSYNQAKFIEDTIQSVLQQSYKNFEHIIVDGGSTDGTIEILRKYPHLKWISEKDRGQSNAINKGFHMASGKIVAWLNSDDYYERNIFAEIADYFNKNSGCNFLYGDIVFVDEKKQPVRHISGDVMGYHKLLENPDLIRQPSSFWRRSVLEEVGMIDENLHMVMDFEFFLRIAKKYEMHYINRNISYFRFYSNGKTSRLKKKQIYELTRILIRERKLQVYKSSRFVISKIIRAFKK